MRGFSIEMLMPRAPIMVDSLFHYKPCGNHDSTISVTLKQKNAKITQKIKTRAQRTIFFKLKRNVKINDKSAKRIWG
jgi:hypothetical protein